MGGGGGESTSTTGPPAWMQPYVTDYIQRARQLSMTPYEAYPGQTVARMAPAQEAGLQAIEQRALGGAPEIEAAQREYGRTVGGEYLGANPYLDQAYEAASRGMANQYRYATAPAAAAAASRAGAYGGSAYNELRQQGEFGLGQNLADLASGMYGGAYEAERGRQVGALGMAPQFSQLGYMPGQMLLGAGGVTRGYEQQLLDATQQAWQQAQEYPYRQLDVLGGAVGTGLGGQQSTTVQSGK